MDEHDYAVIMAGGGGTRLWPVSRKDSPKQLLHLLGEETLFQGTVARLIDLFPPERILVVTVEQQAAEMKKQVPEIPVEKVSAALVMMELKGMVRQVGAMHYVAVREVQSGYSA